MCVPYEGLRKILHRSRDGTGESEPSKKAEVKQIPETMKEDGGNPRRVYED